MFQMPMSSPMMTTMFGDFAAEAGATPAADVVDTVAVVAAVACASSRFLPTPSEQQGGLSAPWLLAAVSPATCRVVGVAPSARDEGLKSLVAATKPSMVPSPTQANA